MKHNGYQVVVESFSSFLDKAESPVGQAAIAGGATGAVALAGYTYFKKKANAATDPEVKHYYHLQMKALKRSLGAVPGATAGAYVGRKLGSFGSIPSIVGGPIGMHVGAAPGLYTDKAHDLRREIIELRKKLKKQGKL